MQRRAPRSYLSQVGLNGRNVDDVVEEIYRVIAEVETRLEKVTTSSGISLNIGDRTLKADKVTLSAGSQTVTFPDPTNPMTGTYIILRQAKDSSNFNQEVEVSGETAYQFTAKVFAACTLDYLAIQT